MINDQTAPAPGAERKRKIYRQCRHRASGRFTGLPGNVMLVDAETLRGIVGDVLRDQADKAVSRAMAGPLENCITDMKRMSESEDDMPERIRQRIQFGTDANGRPITHWVSGSTVQDLVNNALKLVLKQAPEPENTNCPAFGPYAENWMTLYKVPKLRRQTLSTYRSLLDKHLLPFFGKKRLSEIDVATLQTFFNENSRLSKSSARQMKIILHQIFAMAMEDGYMRMNPTESKRLALPTRVKKREALTDEQTKAVIRSLPKLDARDQLLVAIPLFTGMRRGEMLGLRWEHIDLEKKRIHVQQAVTFRGNQPVVGPPKSEAGNRIIPLSQQLEDILRPLAKEQGFVIGSGEEPITEKMLKRSWERITKRIDLFGATLHVLRHTYITIAASSGADVKTVQSISGHSDIRMTLERYAHAREAKVLQAGELICNVFRTM